MNGGSAPTECAYGHGPERYERRPDGHRQCRECILLAGRARYRAHPKPGPVERFWPKVDRSGACWPWVAHLCRGGYGHFRVRGKLVLAHRFAWELAQGHIPAGLDVLHHCDNPPCVKTEPDEQYPHGHLFLGTHAENMADMVRKGRGVNVRGEGHHQHKLTDQLVRVARQRYHAGESQAELAQAYGVARTTVRDAIRGHTWAHIEAAA